MWSTSPTATCSAREWARSRRCGLPAGAPVFAVDVASPRRRPRYASRPPSVSPGKGSNRHASTRRHQRLRPHRPQRPPRRAQDVGRHRDRRSQRITDNETLAHLLKYDSVFGLFPGTVEVGSDSLVIDGREVRATAERDPGGVSAGDLGVDVVIESTGLFRKREGEHLDAARRRSSSPRAATEPDATVVLGLLRRRRRRRQPRRHLKRVVHHQLPRARGQGPPRHDRHRARPDDDDPCLHGRPEPAARPHGPAPRPRRRGQPRAGLDRGGQADRLHPGAQRQAAWLRRARTRAERLRRRPHVRGRPRHVGRGDQRDRGRSGRHGPVEGILQYTEDPIVSGDIIGNNYSSIFDSALTAVLNGKPGQGRRGTTTSGATPAGWWSWPRRCSCVRTLDELDVDGKRVLVRVDFKCPARRRPADHRRLADPRSAADAEGAAGEASAAAAGRAPGAPRGVTRSSRCAPRPTGWPSCWVRRSCSPTRSTTSPTATS